MEPTKTIIEKLNLIKYPEKAILHIPEYIDDFKELEYDAEIKKDKYDLIFIFIFSLEEFTKNLQLIIENHLMNDKGYLFFAYPKKNNRKYEKYIDRDSFFKVIPMNEDDGYVHNSNLKFSRMVSLNEDFTVVGLKSEPKKVKKGTNPKSSQCVDDYIDHVNEIKKYLSNKEDLLKIYNGLTFGYQKNWARYVYSAKRQETQENRLSEMERILMEGYKSIDLYRKNKK